MQVCVDKLKVPFILTIIKHQDHTQEIQPRRDVSTEEFGIKRSVYAGKYIDATIQPELYYNKIF